MKEGNKNFLKVIIFFKNVKKLISLCLVLPSEGKVKEKFNVLFYKNT